MRPLRLIFVALVLVGAVACGRPPEPLPRNIFLITIDTLRADHLSGYGYSRDTSPVIDRLAADGVRFDQAAVQWPKTGPSFASIFTATYPKNNGIVRKIGMALPWEFRMLAEELGAHGYSTHAVVANGAVASEFNFHQGFDTYIETWKLPADGDEDTSRADMVTRLAVDIAANLDGARPVFLWIHYLDPHFPYTPPGEWSDRYQGDEWFESGTTISIDRSKRKREMTGIGREQVLDEQDDLAFYVARYDAEIAYTDSQVGELLEGLDRLELLDGALTVLTSDHGESLGEHHYYFDHGRLGFQTCLRVPLIFHLPGVLKPAVDHAPVELVHLMPTVLELAGIELEEGRWLQGRSLVPRLLGQRSPRSPSYAFSEAGYGRRDMWQRVVRDERFKLVDAQEGEAQRWITGQVGRRLALYDLLVDPGETVNVVDTYAEEAARLREVLAQWYSVQASPLIDEAPSEEAAREMDAETRRQLEALGYL